MASEKDDGESPWKGPSSVKDLKARRWMSSTAASLLDNHDEEEEEGCDEPDLLSVSIESVSGSSKESQAKKLADRLQAIEQTQTESATVSSVVRLTEGMTGMLCSASLEEAETIFAVKLGGHRRIDSETEVLQKDLATGHCGTAATFCMPPKSNMTASTKDLERTMNESLTMLTERYLE